MLFQCYFIKLFNYFLNRDICNDMKLNAINTMKVIKAIKSIPNAAINETKYEPAFIFLGIEEKKILDKLNQKNDIISTNINCTSDFTLQGGHA